MTSNFYLKIKFIKLLHFCFYHSVEDSDFYLFLGSEYLLLLLIGGCLGVWFNKRFLSHDLLCTSYAAV